MSPRAWARIHVQALLHPSAALHFVRSWRNYLTCETHSISVSLSESTREWQESAPYNVWECYSRKEIILRKQHRIIQVVFTHHCAVYSDGNGNVQWSVCFPPWCFMLYFRRATISGNVCKTILESHRYAWDKITPPCKSIIERKQSSPFAASKISLFCHRANQMNGLVFTDYNFAELFDTCWTTCIRLKSSTECSLLIWSSQQ